MKLIQTAAIVVALFLPGMTVGAQAPSGEIGSAVRAKRKARPSQNAAAALLRKRVEKVEWVDTPFEDVIDWLKDQGEGMINVLPRWNALSVESIDQDTLVTLELVHMTVAEILIETLEQIMTGSEIGFRAHGNTLKISTEPDFDRKLHVRIYDLTDLTHEIRSYLEFAPTISLQQAGQGGGSGGGGTQSPFQSSGGGSGNLQQQGDETEQDIEDRLTELQTLIPQMIEPASWSTSIPPGPGTIAIYQRSLIVNNTVKVHEQLAGYFLRGG